jgi:HAD superfamily hydrolase (TIGR01490 family)
MRFGWRPADTPTGYVFFDFDKTIIHGDAGPMFGAWMFRRRQRRADERHVRPVAAARKGLMAARMLPYVGWMAVQTSLYKIRAVRRSTVIKNAYKGLKGMPSQHLDDAMEEFANAHVAPLIYPQIRAEIQAHLDASRDVVILTTGMEKLVSKVLPHLPPGVQIIGCKLHEKRGRLTGKIVSGPLYGADKANIVRAYCDANGVDPATCFAYTDHFSDHHMLEAVGHGVCINPAPRLRKMAAKLGWRVMDLPSPIDGLE